MKFYIIALLAIVGCAKPIPPEVPKPEVITVTSAAVPVMVEVVPKEDVNHEEPVEVLETWYTEESNAKKLQDYTQLSKAIEEAAHKGICMCRPGDPSCDCL